MSGMMQCLKCATLLLLAVSLLCGSASASDSYRLKVANGVQYLDLGSVSKYSPVQKISSRVCSKDCGANSGSATCKENETCDCACNRQPICQCR